MNPFSTGLHRPVYLWAGPGTIRMNRLKFMGASVDEQVHLAAHTTAGASLVADQCGFNWAYLMFDWGFPPEIEAEDFKSFQQAVVAYHNRGIKVFAYIQTSNCVDQGSFRDKDWYAHDPNGHRIPYYTGRFMTCWKHPEWVAHLEAMVCSALGTGADGIFFDNPWHGGQLLNIGGVWLGSPGCFCPRCRQAYRDEAGQEIPTEFYSIREEQSRYLKWRSFQVSVMLARLADLARHRQPGIMISVNNFDAVMRPSYLIYGIDLASLARIQDVVMIEDYGLPFYEESKKVRWVNNVLTLHTANAICGGTPVSVDPYDRGIGFDSVYPARRYLQGLAEAAACGAAMVVKGTEYVDHRKFTLLTAPQFGSVHRQLKSYHHWLETNHFHFEGRTNLAKVGVLYPGESFWQNWNATAPCYFGVGQSLLAMGIPWRVVSQPADLQGLEYLITCDHLLQTDWVLPEKLKVIALSSLPGWAKPAQGRLWRNKVFVRILSSILLWLYKRYFDSRLVRTTLDSLGVMRLFTCSPYFNLPDLTSRTRLKEELPVCSLLKQADGVLVETWQKGNQWQIHLVNYAGRSRTVTIEFPNPVSGLCFSPDRTETIPVRGSTVSIPLDIYNILIIGNPPI